MIYLVVALSLIGLVGMVWKREWMLPILAMSLPFERIPSADIWEVTLRPSNILFLGALILVGVDLLQKREKPVWQKYDWLLVIYLIIAMISLRGAIEVSRGWQVIAFTIFVLVVFWLTRYLVGKEGGEKIVKPVIWISGVVATFGLYQYLGDTFGLSMAWTGLRKIYIKEVLGFPRIQSTMLEPLYLGNFLIIPLSLLIVAEVKNWLIISRKWRHILFILLGAVFMLTVSRGAYLGIIGTLLTIILVFIKSLKWENLKYLIFDIVVIMVIAWGLVVLPGLIKGQGIKSAEKFSSHTTTKEDVSANDRKFTATVALKAWKSSPWIGIGPGNFGPYIAKEAGVSHRQIANNETVELLAETGIIGFGVILAFLILIIKGLVLVYRDEKKEENRLLLAGLGAALAGILVQYQFFSTLYIVHIWFLLGWIIGMTKSKYPISNQYQSLNNKKILNTKS